MSDGLRTMWYGCASARWRARGLSFIVACFVWLALTCGSLAQERGVLNGIVVDSTESPIHGAQIELRSATGTILASSDEQGYFRITGAENGGTLVVSFPGFATVAREIHLRASAESLHVILTPASGLQRVEVQATVGDLIPAVPNSEYVLSAESMNNMGSLVVDDMLRQVPGFSTFRRSSSLFANPTSQGVSLRGVGASATSRSTVLLDGIPLNDPFGGWVYWARVPQEAIASMEVANGGASDLYGGGALGGVVNLRTRTEETAYASAEMSMGSMSTPDFSFAAGAPIGKWAISGAASGLSDAGIYRGSSGPAWRGRHESGFRSADGLSGRLAKSGGTWADFCAWQRLWRERTQWNSAAEKRHDHSRNRPRRRLEFGGLGKFLRPAVRLARNLSSDFFVGRGGSE